MSRLFTTKDRLNAEQHKGIITVKTKEGEEVVSLTLAAAEDLGIILDRASLLGRRLAQ